MPIKVQSSKFKVQSLRLLALCFVFCILYSVFCILAFGQEVTLREAPIQISANSMSYDRKREISIARGDVKIVQEEAIMTADLVAINFRTNIAVAKGNVAYTSNGDVLRADRLKINFATKLGSIDKGDLFVKRYGYHIRGQKVDKTGEKDYKMGKSSFTTCSLEEPTWKVKSKEVRVYNQEFTVGKGTTFYLKNLPLFYLPVFVAPIGRERQSGLLVPKLGFSDRDGLKFQQPLFWDISKNKDTTFSVDLRSYRGIGEGLEYRYAITEDSNGRLSLFNFTESDPSPDSDVNRLGKRDRTRLFTENSHFFSDSLFAKARINLVSDIDYFRDFEDAFQLRTERETESNLFLTKNWQNYSVSPKLMFSQDLVIEDDVTTQRTPSVDIVGLNHQLGKTPFFFNLYSSFSYLSRGRATRDLFLGKDGRLFFPPAMEKNLMNRFFPRVDHKGALLGIRNEIFIPATDPTFPNFGEAAEFLGKRGVRVIDKPGEFPGFFRDIAESALRFDMDPHISIPFRPWGKISVIPEIGFRETLYQVHGGKEEGSLSREIFTGGLGVSIPAERIFSVNIFGINKVKHFLEPAISYQHRAILGEEDPPFFDEIDLLEDRNLLLFSLNNHFLGKILSPKGEPFYRNLLKVGFTQGFDLNISNQNFHYDVARQDYVFIKSHRPIERETLERENSDLLSEVDMYILENLALSLDFTYNWRETDVTTSALSVNYLSPRRGYLNLSYRFSRYRKIEELDTYLRVRLNRYMDALYDSRYNAEERTLLESNYGIELKDKDSCIAAQLFFTDRLNDRRFQIFLSIRGLGTTSGFRWY